MSLTLRSSGRALASALALVLLPPLVLALQDGPAGDPVASEDGATAEATDTYALVVRGATPIRTLGHANGPVVVEAEIGQVLRIRADQRIEVRDESVAHFLPVELPGGYPAWVYGANLRATDEEGVLEVTANAVIQRPQPSSDLTSYPFSVRLHGGDRLRVIERADESKPLAEDWIRVWSAPTTVGWVRSDRIEELDGEKGERLWVEALSELGARSTVREPGTAASAAAAAAGSDSDQPAGAGPDDRVVEAREAVRAAEALLAAERQKDAPDFGAARAAYEGVLAMEAGAALTGQARAGLSTIAALEEALAVKAELEAEKLRRQEDLLRRQKEAWEASRAQDPLFGRFDARGVLERRSRAGQPHRYVLRWGPDQVCEVRCASGRYDLDTFAGYEIGLKGALTYQAPDGLLADKPVLEVGRLEVLKRR